MAPAHLPQIPPIDVAASLKFQASGPGSAPQTPHGLSPTSPTSDGRRKANPLTDLVDTEKEYVDLLMGIIRKVAAAWSRSNLPPPELDTMFRCIESIYKANRSLGSKLKEIGTDPKGLGDLLMRWIDDLETPYTNYCTKYCTGFDDWEPVQTNTRLRTILAMFSSSNPPPLPPSSPQHPSEPPIWTLDELFLLPQRRLKYYKKLYTRLLSSTAPGRSDYKWLSGALEKLDRLMAILDERATTRISALPPPPPAKALNGTGDNLHSPPNSAPLEPLPQPDTPRQHPQRESNSTHGSSANSSGGRRSEDTAPSSDGRGSGAALSVSINDLDRRLSTDRTLDLFTMAPKSVRLQISPPNLHYTRELRISADVIISLTPRSTGIEVVQDRGHLFILTDLLLICERMTPSERAQVGPGGPDMWLLYPPLAGKHLKVQPMEGSDTAFVLTILRKETMYFHTDSRQLRDRLVTAFRECIDTAASLMPPSKNTPPPVPALPGANTVSRQPSRPPDRKNTLPQDGPPRDSFPERTTGSMSPPERAFSPGSGSTAQRPSADRIVSPPPRDVRPEINRGTSESSLGENLSRLHISPDAPHNLPLPPSPMYPPRSTSAAPAVGGPGPSFSPVQVMPGQPFRPAPGQMMPQSFAPGQVMPSGGFDPARSRPPHPPGGSYVVPPPRDASRTVPPPESGPNGMHQMAGRPGPGPGPGYAYGPPRGPNGAPVGPGYPAPGQSRPPSDSSYQSSLHKSPSSRSLSSQNEQGRQMPPYPEGLPPPRPHFGLPRSNSSSSLSSSNNSLHAPQPRPLLPSAQISLRTASTVNSFADPSPPESPVEETRLDTGPVTSKISAQMKCKVFLKQHHAQWKSLGTARLKLYHESPTNIKQLVVEAEKDKSVMISTIVLTDGVERVGKTGVAIELSNRGQRTGIVYMIQLRNEQSAGGLFDSLLVNSDRSVANGRA
ncbi:hypothetical protein CERSUDRAFT_110759 [Gelatoporia subvermispora B]|uniref:DH domain-containing protein n=1 Tax=Ceriporiopsis subvermispora (strain B) TaxID=914234 RepID=M2RTF2_CERS8|nr:hypothetical protein CERSUDRAFT_110759 [Gelatoporia subvermispora B]